MSTTTGASILNKGQAIIAAKYQAPEQRRKEPSVMEVALKNQDFSIPNAAILRTSPLRPVEIYWFKDIAAGTDTAKAYNHAGTFGDTAASTVTYIQHVQSFAVPYKIGANNVFSHQDQFNNAFEMACKNLRTRQDNSALAFLASAKNQLDKPTMDARLAAAGLTGWNAGTFALEISDADSKLFMQKIKDAMAASNYSDDIDVIADIQSMSNFLNYMNQGSGNQNNLGWQFLGMNPVRTQTQIDSAYPRGAVYAMPKGMLAGLNWNEQANRTGLPNADLMNNVGQIGTVADPLGSGAIFDISMYVNRQDTSANTVAGSTQDFVLNVEVTSTIGYVTAPLSLAGDSPIIEIAQAS